MKTLSFLVSLVVLSKVYAAPPISNAAQAFMGIVPPDRSFEATASQYLSEAKQAILKGKHNFQKWFHDGNEYIKQDNLLYELISHSAFSDYQLRVGEPEGGLCDASVKQHSGYLDDASDRHLFFWFFEARKSPETAPLVLWLNGGPGCSSTTGLLFELGPCSIANEGKNTTWNPNSWTEHANVIFLDQPVNVGYSYSDDSTNVDNSPAAAKDVYAFLELFLQKYPKYAKLPFHIAAESYGGTYAPHFANFIHKENKRLALAPNSQLKHINLESVILANGRTDPLIQYGSVQDYACNGPYPIFDGPDSPQCQSIRTKTPVCERLLSSCYRFNSKLTCFPAQIYCDTQLIGPFLQTGLNPYDVRVPCDREKNGDLCYNQMLWIETWMNDPKVKATLGVNPTKTFASCNMDVNKAFVMNGDGMHNSALLLPELINDGIRLLVYAGDADFLCNYIGNQRWVEKLETKFTEEYATAEFSEWIAGKKGHAAGEVRSAGGNSHSFGNLTFASVYGAGHMVPYNQPEAAFELFTKWIYNKPLSLKSSAL